MAPKPEKRARDGTRRGGVRLGPDGRPLQGRKKKLRVPATGISEVDFARMIAAPRPVEIDAVAQSEANNSIAALVRQIVLGESESAKVAACVTILDRGYGKPAVEIGGDAAMLPFLMAPQKDGKVSITEETRAEARKFAVLAFEALKRIRDQGSSESARVAAAKALLDRGLGTVGKARMPDEQRERPLGKKEEAARAAEAAATGRFATPSPPQRGPYATLQ